VKRGAVLVEVDHPGWLQMLQLKKSQLLKNIRKRYPELEIRDIRCFLQRETKPETESREGGIKADLSGSSDQTENERATGVSESGKEGNNSKEYQEFKDLLERLKKKAEDSSRQR